MKPKFVVIEGLDGSGKSTQISLLQEYLQKQRVDYRHIHFPRLGQGTFGALVAEFLRGSFGKLEDVHPKLVALLYAGDRHDFADTIRQWLGEGNLVIADRYVYSNIAFQCAKTSDEKEKYALRNWILGLEYSYYQIPVPDLSIFLNVPTKAAAEAMTDDSVRNGRDYLDGARDIHEADLDFQSRVHQEYLQLVNSVENFHLIPCIDDTGQRCSPLQTHAAIIRKLQEMNILVKS